AQEHARGPAVRDDVVQVDEQHVLLLPDPQQRGPDQAVLLQVERPRRLAPGDAQRLGETAHVDDRQVEARERQDLLHRLAVAHGEARAQRLVAADDLGQARPQRGDVEAPYETGGEGNVV